jgi:BlaI family transcriptional regulator, penicillinase repressor
MSQIPRISDAEWQVMKTLWEKSPATTVEVVEQLAPSTQWTLKTVLTLLNRLVKKGAVRFEKQGRAYLYYPAVEERDCLREENRNFLDRVYGGALKPMLANFFEEAELSAADIQELKKILDAKGRKK